MKSVIRHYRYSRLRITRKRIRFGLLFSRIRIMKFSLSLNKHIVFGIIRIFGRFTVQLILLFQNIIMLIYRSFSFINLCIFTISHIYFLYNNRFRTSLQDKIYIFKILFIKNHNDKNFGNATVMFTKI